jgi:phage head maturation protease
MMNDFTMYIPISKVDEETRTVGGWATTEEIDKQNEVVDYSGSKEAFSNWQGNIREMHEPKAVGKAVEILPSDEEKRVWVKAYISKGADDTWQKVREGILTGFSIGGQTVHKTAQIIKDTVSGSSKTVTRITKYRLNELSLVDNPANPGCSFTLVKNIDGVPMQTEIVEDTIKTLINEADDPLRDEVREHRDKADALIKKVLDSDEIEKLPDDHFGVIRKYKQGDNVIKQRLLPMNDKVHAVRTLSIMEKYNLTPDEATAVLKKAQGLLGAAFNTHVNRGGETDVSNIDLTKFTETIESLVKRIESLEKAFEGAHRPIPSAKELPVESTYTPAIGEAAPAEAGAADGAKTEEGAIEATEKAMAGAADGNIVDAPEVKPSATEEPKAAAEVMPEVKTACN